MSPGPRAAPHLRRRALAQVASVFRHADEAFAPFSCPASGECCQLSKTGRPPWLFEAEWAFLTDALARDGRALPPPREDGGCPFLDEEGKRCTVYEARPLGCRTFFCGRRVGTARDPVQQMSRFTRQLEEATFVLGGEGAPQGTEPRPLQSWIDEARR